MPVRTIHSGPNPRYFGQERGVTWYNLASDQFTGLNEMTVPGTLRDSLNLLAIVLEQETELQPTEIMTDTAGYTDTIFGIFYLLGYQFSPRIADVGGARFWRADAKADYGILDDFASNRINMKLIADHWDDLLRLAGSLKLGVVQAAGLTRTLQTNDRPTRLARALQELGRLIKTLYLLRFIDDESYRRRILIQLNRGEGRHQIARVMVRGAEVAPIDLLTSLLPHPNTLVSQYKGKVCVGSLITGLRGGVRRSLFYHAICDHEACYRDTGTHVTLFTTAIQTPTGSR